MACFVSASETHCQANLNKSIDGALADYAEFAPIAKQFGITLRGAVATAFGCPFEGDVSSDNVLKIIDAYMEGGARHISLGDTTGMATPPVVTRTVEAIRARFPEAIIALHFHNTRGAGLASAWAAVQAGVARLDSSIGGLGGCPFAPGASGNIATEDLVYLLRDSGVGVDIDLDAAIEAARVARTAVGHDLPSALLRAGDRIQS